jgi:hypothetical protein
MFLTIVVVRFGVQLTTTTLIFVVNAALFTVLLANVRTCVTQVVLRAIAAASCLYQLIHEIYSKHHGEATSRDSVTLMLLLILIGQDCSDT